MDNHERATYGKHACMAGDPDAASNHHDGEHETSIVDTLANVMHYAESLGLNVPQIILLAKMHLDEEIRDEDCRN